MSEKTSINIFQAMVNPRVFMRRIMELPRRQTWYVAYFVGIVWLFDRALHFQLGFSTEYSWIVMIAIVLGIPAGYFYFYLTSWLLYWTGKIFKGKGSFEQVYQAFVWSKAPDFFVMLAWFGIIALLKPAAFTNVLIYTGLPFLVPMLIWVQLIFGIWSYIILFHTLGEVQQFSAWISIWNVLVTFFILGILYQLSIYFIGGVMEFSPMAAKEVMFMGKF